MEKNSNSLRPWIYLAGFSMSGFSSGLITCINTLLFLSRGLSLSLFSLAIGLNFITVMVLEMPSGIAGDLWGRKRVWMISRVMTLASLPCIWKDGCMSAAKTPWEKPRCGTVPYNTAAWESVRRQAVF